ncbi:MAG: hypothetical protein ACTSSK_10390 [Candidatus Heimdallarchaeota archaeon]
MSSDLPALFHITPKTPYTNITELSAGFVAAGVFVGYPNNSVYALDRFCLYDYVIVKSNTNNTNANMFYWSRQGAIQIYIYPRTPIRQTDNQLLLIFRIKKVSGRSTDPIQILLFNDVLKEEVIDGEENIAILTDIPATGGLLFYVRPKTTYQYMLMFKSVTGYLID